MRRTWLCWTEAYTGLARAHLVDPIVFKQSAITRLSTLDSSQPLERRKRGAEVNSGKMGTKRQSTGDDRPAKASKISLVNSKRVRELSSGDRGSGPVLYWCAFLTIEPLLWCGDPTINVQQVPNEA